MVATLSHTHRKWLHSEIKSIILKKLLLLLLEIMASRSFFTLLTLAMVAMLSFVAAVIEDGVYIIASSDGLVLTASNEPGAVVTAEIEYIPPGAQQWVVENKGYKGYTIKHLGFTPEDPEYYLSPVDPEKIAEQEKVVLSNTPFYWDLYNTERFKAVIFVKEYNPVTPSVLAVDSDIVELQTRSGSANQEWEFRGLHYAKQEVRSRSRPWRIDQGSRCL